MAVSAALLVSAAIAILGASSVSAPAATAALLELTVKAAATVAALSEAWERRSQIVASAAEFADLLRRLEQHPAFQRSSRAAAVVAVIAVGLAVLLQYRQCHARRASQEAARQAQDLCRAWQEAARQTRDKCMDLLLCQQASIDQCRAEIGSLRSILDKASGSVSSEFLQQMEEDYKILMRALLKRPPSADSSPASDEPVPEPPRGPICNPHCKPLHEVATLKFGFVGGLVGAAAGGPGGYMVGSAIGGAIGNSAEEPADSASDRVTRFLISPMAGMLSYVLVPLSLMGLK